MVGVPKSTGCLVCRKRKIKCDETWPKCVNCQKNSKSCPGPPDRHTFKDLVPSFTGGTINPLEGPSRTAYCQKFGAHADSTGRTNKGAARPIFTAKDTGPIVYRFRALQTDHQIKKKTKKNRVRSVTSADIPIVFHSPSMIQPSLPPHYELSRTLIDMIESSDIGSRISTIDSFIRALPRRIGHNTALDSAIGCLVHAHLNPHSFSSVIDDPRLYLSAVQELQACLADDENIVSPNTLGAAVVLSLVEVLAGPTMGNCYLAHIEGASRLLEIQGPGGCQDTFVKDILYLIRGSIVATSLYRLKPCFLLSPEWCKIAFNKADSCPEDISHTEVLYRMAEVSSFMEKFRDLDVLMQPSNIPDNNTFVNNFESGSFMTKSFQDLSTNSDLSQASVSFAIDDAQTYFEAQEALLFQIHTLRASLDEMGTKLTAQLLDESVTTELPSQDDNSPIHFAYQFSHWRTAVVYATYCSSSIMLRKLLLRLLPLYDPSCYVIEAECRNIALEICKTWENAQTSKPSRACHVWLAFVVAYEYCSENVQMWMLMALNKLLKEQGVRDWQWTEELVGAMSAKLMGEGTMMIFPNM